MMRRQRRTAGSRRGCSYYYKCAADDEKNACSTMGSDGDDKEEGEGEGRMKEGGNVSVEQQRAAGLGQTKKKKNAARDDKVGTRKAKKKSWRGEGERGRRVRMEEEEVWNDDDDRDCCGGGRIRRRADVENRRSMVWESPGWPLRIRNGGGGSGKAEEREMSVVEWAMRLPERLPAEERVAEQQQKLAPAPAEEEEKGHKNNNNYTRSEAESAGRIIIANRRRRRRRRRRRLGCGGVAIGRAVTDEEEEQEEEEEEDLGGGMVRRRRRRRRSAAETEVAISEMAHILKRKADLMCHGTVCKEFRFLELEVATQCFAQENMIGEGGCSRVYRGRLADGKMIAVKRLLLDLEYCSSSSSCTSANTAAAKSGGGGFVRTFLPSPQLDEVVEYLEDAFVTEVGMMSRLHHRHVAKLLGYCIHLIQHQQHHLHLLLVYKLASGGSLDKLLHPDYSTTTTLVNVTPLHNPLIHMDARIPPWRSSMIMTWDSRFSIALGVAQALHYLHHVSVPPVIHRDIKPSNILLSSNLEPLLADFGLAIWASSTPCHYHRHPSSSSSSPSPKYRSKSDVVGTFGYLAPEYLMFNTISHKTDVYSFGVVLVELITGRKPIDVCRPSGEIVVSWARRHLAHVDDSNIEQLIDPKLGGAYDANQLRKLAIAASRCLRQSPRCRPSISWVLRLLMGEIDDDDHHDHDATPEDLSHNEMATWSNDRDHSVNRKSADKYKHMEDSNELAERLSECVLEI